MVLIVCKSSVQFVKEAAGTEEQCGRFSAFVQQEEETLAAITYVNSSYLHLLARKLYGKLNQVLSCVYRNLLLAIGLSQYLVMNCMTLPHSYRPAEKQRIVPSSINPLHVATVRV